MDKKPSIGGQAVIEGVMIRNQKHYAVAVRKKDKIVTKKVRIKQRKGIFYKLPIVRGFYNLVDMLVIGMKTLMWSANQAAEEEGEKITKKEMIYTVLISFLIAILFFVALPYFLTFIIGFKEESNPFLFNFIDGIIRILIFLAYILGISFLKDVKRLFQYHGAEHMAVHCYENNKKLTIENIKKFPTLHPRCGTSFIMIVLIISILVFSILPPIVLYLFPGFANFSIIFRKIILFSLRISLIPLIAGVSYELLKLSDKFKDSFMMNVFIQPGLWFQKITTKKPNKRQIEVARKSVMVLLNLK